MEGIMFGWLKQMVIRYWLDEKGYNRPFISQFKQISQHIRPGDIILVESNSRACQLVKKVTMSPWAHVSLYLGRLHDIESEELKQKIIKHYNPMPNEQLIFESVFGKGNYVDNLQTYKDKHIRLCRPYQISHEDTQRVIAFALKQLEQPYNLRHFIDLGRFLWAAKFIPRRWNSSLFSKDNKHTHEICSGMIAKAFMSVHYPILPTFTSINNKQPELIHRNPKLFVPADFDYSPYFKIIKFPKFHTYDTPAYHHMPWNEAYISNDEIGVSENTQFYTTYLKKMDAEPENVYDGKPKLGNQS